jgi:hypothetical protein
MSCECSYLPENHARSAQVVFVSHPPKTEQGTMGRVEMSEEEVVDCMLKECSTM